MNLTAEPALHNGKYILDTQLGEGVFASTYRATNTESRQTVVIKTIGENLSQHSDFDQFKQRFLKLAERLKSCEHPNLVKIIDCFEEAGRPYLVMEYIPGETLAELIQSHVLPEAKAIEYIRQIGDALSVLHKAGLLHRDVKPQNIIQRQDCDSVVLCEFGITCELTPGVMQTHASLISAGYAPLELYSLGSQHTPATDIYALAATLYCLLTGRPPLPAPVREVLHSDKGNHLFPSNLQQPNYHLSRVVKKAIWCGLQIAQRRPQNVEAWLSLLQTQEKSPTSGQPARTRRSEAKLKAPASGQANSTAVPTKSQTRQPPNQNKSPTPEPALIQALILQLKAQNSKSKAQSPKPKAQSSKLKAQSSKLKTPKARLPLQALLMTGAIAASAGIGFGFALRINGSDKPGSTFLHTKQAFPPSSNWPMSGPH